MPEFMTFEDARATTQEWVSKHKQQIKKSFPKCTWNLIYKSMCNARIPENPSEFYDEFIGYKDWIGNAIYPPSNLSEISVKTDKFPDPCYIEEKNSFDAGFNKNLRDLWRFGCEHGTYIIPSELRYLQHWGNLQRSIYKKGAMNQDRINALRSIHFDFEPQMEDFSGYYKLLLAFKELHGHVDIPCRYMPNRKLGDWVKSQRIYYRRGHLSKHKIEKLNAIGFKWEVPREERFLPIEKRGGNDKAK